jgi:hypothetical protein
MQLSAIKALVSSEQPISRTVVGQILQPFLTDFPQWTADYAAVKERVGRNVTSWAPTIMAWNTTRNKKRVESGTSDPASKEPAH